jgi:hypothetical protein
MLIVAGSIVSLAGLLSIAWGRKFPELMRVGTRG